MIAPFHGGKEHSNKIIRLVYVIMWNVSNTIGISMKRIQLRRNRFLLEWKMNFEGLLYLSIQNTRVQYIFHVFPHARHVLLINLLSLCLAFCCLSIFPLLHRRFVQVWLLTIQGQKLLTRTEVWWKRIEAVAMPRQYTTYLKMKEDAFLGGFLNITS